MPFKTQYRVSLKQGRKPCANLIVPTHAFHQWAFEQNSARGVSNTFEGRREQLQAYIQSIGHDAVVTDWELDDVYV